MLLYANRTQFPAIVTLKLEGTDDPTAALKIGSEEFFEKIGGKTGYFDLVVDGGKELHLINNTVATFVSVRAAS